MVKLLCRTLLACCCLHWVSDHVAQAQELTPEQRAFMGMPANGGQPHGAGIVTEGGVKTTSQPAIGGPAGEDWPAAKPTLPDGPSMAFRAVGDGGASCCEWIAADGVITEKTPQAFKDFISKLGGHAAALQETVTFNSPGGDFFAALALGREIRRNTQMWTGVGRTEIQPGSGGGGQKAYRIGRGVCLSACVLAFMGGKTRIYEAGTGATAQILAFQSFALDQPASVLGRPSAEAMASAGLPSPGILRLMMEGYATETGIDSSVVAFMETAGQPGGVHLISQEEADRLGLNTPDTSRTKWTLSVKRSGLVLYGAGEDKWTHFTVGLQCLRRERGALEYTMAVPAAATGQDPGMTQDAFRQGIQGVQLRDGAGAGTPAQLDAVQLLPGKSAAGAVLLVTTWLDETQVKAVARGGASLAFDTAHYLSGLLPQISLASPPVVAAVPILLRNCPLD